MLILVVEDHAPLLRALERQIQSFGHRTLAAAALSECDRLPAPDLMVVDQVLPDGFGLDLIERIRRRLQAVVPAVLFSAWPVDQPLPDRTVFIEKTDLDRLPDLFRLLRTNALPNGHPPRTNGSTCRD